MALFPIVQVEQDVQVNDKTRMDCSKSFVSKGSAAIATLTVTPYVGATPISVYDSTDSDNWFLDWSYSDFKVDVASGINDDLVFEVGGTEYTATLTAAAYTLEDYADHVASKMTTAHGGTFTADTSGYEVTITGPSSFEFSACSVTDQLFMVAGDSQTIHGPKTVEFGTRIVACTAADSVPTSATSKSAVRVYSVAGDYLFCSDQDLVTHESDLLKWVAPGRASMKNIIRRSQKLIMAWIDEKGYVDAYAKKYTKTDIVDLEEVRQWSIFMTLRLIFESISNSTEDVFSVKAKKYELLEQSARQRAILRLDYDGDGVVDVNEGSGISSGSLFRR